MRPCRIYVRKTADLSDRDDLVGQQEWLPRRAEAFWAVFAPIVKVALALPDRRESVVRDCGCEADARSDRSGGMWGTTSTGFPRRISAAS